MSRIASTRSVIEHGPKNSCPSQCPTTRTQLDKPIAKLFNDTVIATQSDEQKLLSILEALSDVKWNINKFLSELFKPSDLR